MDKNWAGEKDQEKTCSGIVYKANKQNFSDLFLLDFNRDVITGKQLIL